MTYFEYRDSIRAELRKHAAGMTWAQLQQRLDLPYERPCPTWTRQLEREIGLSRVRGNASPALVWKVAPARSRKTARAS